MDIEVSEFIEKAKITDLITTLFVATDQRRWDEVKACFAPDVMFDMTSLSGGEPRDLSPQQIADGWEHGLAPIESLHHQTGNFRVKLRGIRAEASCYGIAYHYRSAASAAGKTRVFVGTYDFRLELTGVHWRINAFRFILKFVDGNRDLEK